MFFGRDRWVLIASALALFFCCVDQRTAEAQLADDTILFSEFFEEIFRLDPGSAPVDLLNSDIGEGPFGQLIEIIDSSTAIVSSFSELFRFDVSSQQATLLTELSFSPSDITLDTTGNLIATGAPGIVSVNITTGEEINVFDDSFFSPSEVVVSSQGLVYAIEFFDGLGVVNPDTQTFTQIGEFDANELDAIDIGLDGNLIVANSDNEFLQVDPSSGVTTLLGSAGLINPDEIKVDDDGNILYSGDNDGSSSIFSFNPNTGITTTILDGDSVDTFFSILDFDIGSDLRPTNIAIPEPSSTTLLGLIAVAGLLRRHRFNV